MAFVWKKLIRVIKFYLIEKARHSGSSPFHPTKGTSINCPQESLAQLVSSKQLKAFLTNIMFHCAPQQIVPINSESIEKYKEK
jgi:hypothetical protein